MPDAVDTTPVATSKAFNFNELLLDILAFLQAYEQTKVSNANPADVKALSGHNIAFNAQLEQLAKDLPQGIELASDDFKKLFEKAKADLKGGKASSPAKP